MNHYRAFLFAIFYLTTTTVFAQDRFTGWKVKEYQGPSLPGLQHSAAQEKLLQPMFGMGSEIQILRDLPAYLAEGSGNESHLGNYREVYYPAHLLPQELQPLAESYVALQTQWQGSEVRTLRNQGPTNNRIDLVMVGDGYTEAERNRFFQDAERITNDLFNGQTFADYLPLFNVHAVFVPSAQSGLTDRSRVNTALGLYRNPVGSKRAIMPGNTMAIERAIALAPDSDYPILIANDDFYGGLGGRYAITTRSETSGSMVLRHELGHNFGNVGEEYDGGQVYSGANSTRQPVRDWGQWLSGPARLYEGQRLTGAYVWVNLNQNPQEITFTVPAGQTQFDADISTVGWESADDVHVFVDGQRVDLDGVYTADRSFFKLMLNRTLAPGRHTLSIRENIRDGNNVLAFANIYAQPMDLDMNNDQIQGFATFDQGNRHAGYRPTYEHCLMRNMRTLNFCAVDQENMWIRFLDRVSLIDRIDRKQLVQGDTELTVQTPALNSLRVTWYRQSAGLFQPIHFGPTLQVPAGMNGHYRVTVEFQDPQVRRSSPQLMDSQDVQI